MSTDTTTGIPSKLLAELEEAATRADRRVRDPKTMQLAVESLNRLREEIRQRHGLLDIAVPSLRKLRDGSG